MINEHKAVLLAEVLKYINLKENSVYVDCTCGGGGHLSAMLEQAPKNTRFIGMDKDPDAVKALEQKFAADKKVSIVCSDYKDADNVLSFFDLKSADGFLLDLGFSSLQIEDPERGFAFKYDGPLDMRYNRAQSLTAEQVVNDYSEQDLEKILKEYGEEPFGRTIARNIVAARQKKRITGTRELQKIVHNCLYHKMRGQVRIDPATKTFQAIRIEVNSELSSLTQALHKMVKLLAPQGRICVISFHSLEDRIVKSIIRQYTIACTCPKGLPQCICGNRALLKWVVKGIVTAEDSETSENPRSRSAKLRVAEKTA